MGPRQYIQHLISGPRLPFTAAYFGSIALTIYFAVGVSQIFIFRTRLSTHLESSGACTLCVHINSEWFIMLHATTYCPFLPFTVVFGYRTPITNHHRVDPGHSPALVAPASVSVWKSCARG